MAGKQDDSLLGPGSAHAGDRVDLSTSAAGEEDPGASFDAPSDAQAATQAPRQPVGAQPAMAPGDQAPPGTPGTGENLCPQCGGTGRLGAAACPNCQGTGKVIVGIGGA